MLQPICVCNDLFIGFSGANDILEVLDLSWNQIRGKGAIAVAKGIGVSKVTILTLNPFLYEYR